MIILLLYLQTVLFVHQVNLDAQMNSAFLQDTDVMVCLGAQMGVMNSTAVSIPLTNFRFIKTYMYNRLQYT